jgi:hypothetical protein
VLFEPEIGLVILMNVLFERRDQKMYLASPLIGRAELKHLGIAHFLSSSCANFSLMIVYILPVSRNPGKSLQ